MYIYMYVLHNYILLTLMMDYDNPSNRCSYVFMESDTPQVILGSNGIIPGRIINSGFEPCSPDKRWATAGRSFPYCGSGQKLLDDNLHQ